MIIVIQMVIIRTISIMININDLTKKRYNLSNNKDEIMIDYDNHCDYIDCK